MRAAMFLLSAACDARRLALVDGGSGERLTHADLRARVAAAADALRAGGTRLVALTDGQDVATAVAWLASCEAGCALLWLAAAWTPEARLRLIERYRPDLVLPGRLSAGAPLGYDEVDAEPLGRAWRRRASDEAPLHPSLACLLLTSGSTGSPRAARLSRSALASNAAAIVATLELRASDVVVSGLPLAHAFGLSVLNSHLLAGGTVVLTRESVLRAGFWRLARDCAATCLPGLPLTFELLRGLRPEHVLPPSLRLLTQAGGRLALGDVRLFRDLMRARGGELRVMYGQTEATARISVWPRDVPERALGSVGRVLPGGALRLDAANGEILYRGPNVMLGYAAERADLARGSELDELRTGDVGCLDEQGFLSIVARASRLAKLAGRRFDLDDLERLVEDFPAAAVADDERLVVFVEGASRATLLALAASLRARLAVEPATLDVRAVACLPRTSSGKIAYAELAP